ncbi:MAG: ATP synthase F1 subunit gamma [Lachnospiraceae bacterium]|nr:ATP synthase F1 subunit gamma [Lachnospiraceae bacterium]
MANTREIQNRMKSIQDTMKITNAMYMISSNKLRKARKNLEETESYFYTLQSMIARILRHLPQSDIKEYNQYFDHREQKDSKDRVHGFIVVTADKGLAGSYNHNVLKMAQEQMDWGGRFKLFVVGELGRQYFAARGIPVAEQFRYTAQNPTLHRARIISETILEQFREGELDDVHLIYTVMKNGVTTEAQMLHLLPLVAEDFMPKEAQLAGMGKEELVMKPSPQAVLDNIVPDSVMGYIYGALVESFCSEQNARMMAMEAANKNASAMIHELSIQYNRIRQALITQEITEVIAGAKAQKAKKAKPVLQK